jgi:serine/threonine protein phosphatase PrpC
VSLHPLLRCPTCGYAALADDEFCESCGAAVAGPRDAARDHFEIDRGWAAGASDRGLSHPRNEDALFVEAIGDAAVGVVCDGVSTSAAPQIAAQVAAEATGRALSNALRGRDRDAASDRGWDGRQVMAESIAAADHAVGEVPCLPSPGRATPSCTIVAAVWDGQVVTIGWAGDSRAYWVGAAGSERLTLDHSWAQEQIDAGLMPALVAEADGRAHAITRWLGSDGPQGPPSVTVFHPVAPGRLILCSDGLWNYAATADEIGALVAAEPEGASACELATALVRAAWTRGGHDNVAVAVVELAPRLSGQETAERR